jgi:sialidase-1
LQFNNDAGFGSGDYVTSAASVTGDWTVTAWVYWTSSSGFADYIWSPAIGGANVNGIGWAPGSTWGFTDTAGTSVITGTDVPLNTWFFLAVVKSGTTCALYSNGAADGSGPIANENIPAVTIGRRNDSNFGLIGKIDDFRIYNSALTGAQISALYSAGAK